MHCLRGRATDLAVDRGGSGATSTPERLDPTSIPSREHITTVMIDEPGNAGRVRFLYGSERVSDNETGADQVAPRADGGGQAGWYC